tara:strand:- start:21345 stop:21662 length:318 start_codon:yes stop_codon:yes gene_type:complete
VLKFLAPVSDKPKYESRRYRSMWALTAIVTFLFALPPIMSLIMSLFYDIEILFLMDAVIYSSMLGFTWASYLASDWGTKQLGQYIIKSDQKVEGKPDQEDNDGSK